MRRRTLWILLALTAALFLAASAARADAPSESENQTAESVFAERAPEALRSWFGSDTLPPRLTLRLRARPSTCIEATRTILISTVFGGVPPYTVTVGGEPVRPYFMSLTVVCGLAPADPHPCDPDPRQYQTFRATATDSRGVAVDAELRVTVAAAARRLEVGAIVAAPTDTALRLNWTAAEGGSDVCAYELRYQATAWNETDWPDSWSAISDTVIAGATEYLHGNLDPNRRYRYQARARNNIGAGEWSRAFPEAGVRPGAPALAARTAASGSVALSWSLGPAGATRWEYRRQPAGGSWSAWTAITGSDASTAEHTVSGLIEDTRYHFQLRAVTANGASPASATASAIAGLTPTVPSERESLFYDDLDSAGGATRPSSYAFLTDADDLTSGATTFAEVSRAAALLLNTGGYRGRKYADVLATVQVGDRITWFGGRWYHYRVTELLADPPAPARKLFRIALEAEDPRMLAEAQANDPDHFANYRDRYVAFGWEDHPPNEPRIGADGIRIMPYRYAAEGGHTYRLHTSARRTSPSIVIDVPAGMRLIYHGSPAPGNPFATLRDETTGAFLFLDLDAGRLGDYHPFAGRLGGYVETLEDGTPLPAEVLARFKAIIASIRELPLPPPASE